MLFKHFNKWLFKITLFEIFNRVTFLTSFNIQLRIWANYIPYNFPMVLLQLINSLKFAVMLKFLRSLYFHKRAEYNSKFLILQ